MNGNRRSRNIREGNQYLVLGLCTIVCVKKYKNLKLLTRDNLGIIKF